ncbi:thymidylate synthase [Pseudoloma neurophilia]|uniref:thymidylate synthase n=1 Tax=Pseudoloma neurophilia TaxID=146866 RepID=A0A0R0M3B5_9MICR|nr:thymidylate synthase [Pseudoloma neurophilia]
MSVDKKKHEEYQYLDLIKTLMEKGVKRNDRTGTGTLALIGTQMRFSLDNDTLPLLTTKQTAYKSILKELLFFIKGQTDNKILTDQNVHIWTDNSTAEFFEKYGIDREPGDLGPIYGFQWRHCGAKYKTCHDNYEGQGIDQLQNLLDGIKNDPYGRRHIVSSWNPMAIKEMALPPCHTFFQVIITEGKLNLILYQRSADVGLGVPFNIASYAILTKIIAFMTGYEAGEFIHFMADCHIYSNHIDALKEQLKREPYPFPKLKINPKREIKKIDDFEFEDFELIDYECHPRIYMKMAI